MVLGRLSLQKFRRAQLRSLLDAPGYSTPPQNHRNAGDGDAQFVCKLADGAGMTLQNLPDPRLAQLRPVRVCFSLS